MKRYIMFFILALAMAGFLFETASAMTMARMGPLKEVLLTAMRTEHSEREPEQNNNYVPGSSYAKPVPDIDIYDSTTDGFFKNSIFVGDSLMEGFRTYCMSKGDGFLSEPLFLASKSFSLKQALRPISESSRHPYFRGQKMLVEDAVAESKAEKAFLFFGINDMVGLTAEETEKEYNDLIFRIHNKAPDTKIYIIGATYIYDSGQKNGFTNTRIREFNDNMYKYCQKLDYAEFINIGDRLIDSSDGVSPQYSSDKYVHIKPSAYDIWVKVLRAYARDFMAEDAAKKDTAEGRLDSIVF